MSDRSTESHGPGPGEDAGFSTDLEAEFFGLLEQPSLLQAEELERMCKRHPERASSLRAAFARALALPVEHNVRSTPADQLLARLQAAPRLDGTRFLVDENELGRGGMGRVLRVEDGLLRRQLAMKVMLPSRPHGEQERRLQRQRLARFLEEAQVTSQLDHPGVPSVHDLGLDPDGEVYFTMRLVRGDTADHVFRLARTGEGGWTRTRALEVLLKVCDAMAFAHDKGVLHRDIKPRNVMVGRFGEVYVMDWGLAKILDQPDPHDLRIQRSRPVPVSGIHSVRADDAETESSMLTVDGQRIGTPCYMSPEQARGEALDARSDVYAVGAMLYELLAGNAPYDVADAVRSPPQVLERVLRGPPASSHSIAQDVPAALGAICDKAMARERADRYQSMIDLATDLRAYLDERTVAAYRTGPVAELVMWMRRNRELAAALAVAVLILVGGIFAFDRQARVASARKQEFDMLSGLVIHEQVLETKRALYPPWPHQAAPMRAWLDEELGRLTRIRPDIVKTLRVLRDRARLERAVGGENFEDGFPPASVLRLPDDSQRFLYSSLRDLLTRIDTVAAQDRAEVERRLAWAKDLQRLTLAHPDAPATWMDAREAIRRADGIGASTLYRQRPIDLHPQWGLVPLGMNPSTQLWEFYDLRTAADISRVPRLEADGRLRVGPDTGIVFVLIPGGSTHLGSQSTDPAMPNYWKDAKRDERSPRLVDVPPFFIGRHEVTRGQWQRWTGLDPSYMKLGATISGRSYDGTFPVNNVSWLDSQATLQWEGLRLPRENEWEYACRAGTTTPWYTGDLPTSLAGHANIADETARESFSTITHLEGLTDDWVQDAPVGTFAPNAFGLYDMHGNILEWCEDQYQPERFGVPLGPPGPHSRRVARGGSWWHAAENYARSAYRHESSASFSEKYQGVRAARDLW